MDNTRIAVYYCFIGEADYPSAKIPKIPTVCRIHNPIDFYYFTQNEEVFKKASLVPDLKCRLLKSTSTTETEHMMEGKFYKALPHRVPELKEYDYTLYLDTKLEIGTPAWGVFLTEDFIRSVFTPELRFGLFEHPHLMKSVFREVDEAFLQKRYKDQSDQINTYIFNKNKYENYDDTCDTFFQCGYLFRKMNDPITEEICEHWMDEIQECGINDQISFHYVYKKYQEYITEVKRSSFIDLAKIGGEEWREDGQRNWHYFFGQYFHNKTILDVGSGLGYTKSRLAINDNQVTTLDLAPGLNVDLSCSIYEIEDNSYDIVTCFDVIEHIEDDTQFLEKLYKIAKKGVIITTPNFNFSQNKNTHHVREYTPDQLLQKCQKHSLYLNFFKCLNPPFSEVFSQTMETFLLGEDRVLCLYLKKNPADIIL